MKIMLGEKAIKMVFLKPEHLDLVNSYKLQLVDLLSLPSVKAISDDDCLEWLKYQRGIENKYCGFKSTTYDASSVNTKGDFNRQGTVYKTKYDQVLNSDEKVKVGKRCYYHFFNNVLYILHSDNTVMSEMFTESAGNLPVSIYRALLTSVANFGFYYKEQKKLTDTVKKRGYIDAGFVLSKVVA